MYAANSLQRTYAIASKELLHILRDPMTLFFTLFVPVLQMFMLGYAIETNVSHVKTVVLDQANTQETRALLKQFENSKDFSIVGQVYTDEELTQMIVSGKARVGIKIPADYSQRLEAGETAQFLLFADGAESSVAGEVVNAGNAIALRASLEKALGDRPLPVEARPRILFNPDTRSANFFLPGLIVIVCQMMASMLAANAIVREKENGTLEQLFMTPVRPYELMVGKLTPYLFLTLADFCFIALVMRTVFQVPIHGQFFTLLVIAVPFVMVTLGIGLLISTKASTRDAAMQMTMATILPSVFLSGYVFPLDSMPAFFHYFSQLLPTTWLIDASRSVILRGGGWPELWLNAVVLWAMAVGMIALAAARFRKSV